MSGNTSAVHTLGLACLWQQTSTQTSQKSPPPHPKVEKRIASLKPEKTSTSKARKNSDVCLSKVKSSQKFISTSSVFPSYNIRNIFVFASIPRLGHAISSFPQNTAMHLSAYPNSVYSGKELWWQLTKSWACCKTDRIFLTSCSTNDVFLSEIFAFVSLLTLSITSLVLWLNKFALIEVVPMSIPRINVLQQLHGAHFVAFVRHIV